MEEIPNNHLGCKKACKWWNIWHLHIFTISNGAGFLPSSVWIMARGVRFTKIQVKRPMILRDTQTTKHLGKNICIFKNQIFVWVESLRRSKRSSCKAQSLEGSQHQSCPLIWQVENVGCIFWGCTGWPVKQRFWHIPTFLESQKSNYWKSDSDFFWDSGGF